MPDYGMMAAQQAAARQRGVGPGAPGNNMSLSGLAASGQPRYAGLAGGGGGPPAGGGLGFAGRGLGLAGGGGLDGAPRPGGAPIGQGIGLGQGQMAPAGASPQQQAMQQAMQARVAQQGPPRQSIAEILGAMRGPGPGVPGDAGPDGGQGGHAKAARPRAGGGGARAGLLRKGRGKDVLKIGPVGSLEDFAERLE